MIKGEKRDDGARALLKMRARTRARPVGAPPQTPRVLSEAARAHCPRAERRVRESAPREEGSDVFEARGAEGAHGRVFPFWVLFRGKSRPRGPRGSRRFRSNLRATTVSICVSLSSRISSLLVSKFTDLDGIAEFAHVLEQRFTRALPADVSVVPLCPETSLPPTLKHHLQILHL